ncbi:MAG: hypothetical protein E7593_04530 [Ruminococcaceae bacterium]|nr:hypothetical protein [Oscillospiraceae bacterium]
MAYNRDNFVKIKREYENKKRNAIADAESRTAVIHAKYPEIQKIDAELRQTGINIMRETLKGKTGLEERIKSLQERNAFLQAERNKLLTQYGLDTDCTDVKYECNKCQDTGYVGIDMCDCFKNALAKMEFETSGLGSLLDNQSFETFDLSYYLDDKQTYEKMQKNLERCRDFADNFNNKSGNIIFFGATGLGKTHLSTSIARKVIEKGYTVVYDSAPNIFNDFNKEQFKDESGLTDKYFDCDMLIIDDLGTEMHTSFTVSCLYNIVNTRINSGKSMIINTNLNNKELKKIYTDRITSRIFGCFELFLFEGKDIRHQKLQRSR